MLFDNVICQWTTHCIPCPNTLQNIYVLPLRGLELNSSRWQASNQSAFWLCCITNSLANLRAEQTLPDVCFTCRTEATWGNNPSTCRHQPMNFTALSAAQLCPAQRDVDFWCPPPCGSMFQQTHRAMAEGACRADGDAYQETSSNQRKAHTRAEKSSTEM